MAVDAEHHLIVAHEVTNIGHDRSQLASMGKKALEATGHEITQNANATDPADDTVAVFPRPRPTSAIPPPRPAWLKWVDSGPYALWLHSANLGAALLRRNARSTVARGK